MKTFLILSLLAVAATMATAQVQFDPSGQYETQQPFSLQQQPQPFAQVTPFSQEQQQIPEQQQPFLQQQQQPFLQQQQQPFLQQQQPFLQQQQQPFLQQQQQPFLQQQQPFLQQQQQPVQFDPSGQYQSQQPFTQIQQPFTHQQQPFFQPFLQQQLNPCRQFLEQKCSPVGILSFLRLRILQQISCLVAQNQCCRQLAQIPDQLRCPTIHSIVDAVLMQQHQQQQWFLQPLRKLMGQGYLQHQVQQVGQGFTHSQQLGQSQAMRKYALQTLPAMCNVQVSVYCRGAV